MARPPNSLGRQTKFKRSEVLERLRKLGCKPDPAPLSVLESAEWWLTPNGKRFTVPYLNANGFPDFVVQDLLLQVRVLTNGS